VSQERERERNWMRRHGKSDTSHHHATPGPGMTTRGRPPTHWHGTRHKLVDLCNTHINKQSLPSNGLLTTMETLSCDGRHELLLPWPGPSPVQPRDSQSDRMMDSESDAATRTINGGAKVVQAWPVD
jgi:hypothetical protein